MACDTPLMPSLNIIQPDTAIFLKQAGLISPPVNNKQKISTSAISLSSRSSISRNVITDDNKFTASDFKVTNIYNSSNSVEIPVQLESKETLEFMGYTSEKAAEIWTRFCNFPEDMPDDFLSYALEVIEYANTTNAMSANDDW